MNFIKLTTSVFIIFLVSGCSWINFTPTSEPPPEKVNVVVVADQPEPEPIEQPDLPTDSLTEEDRGDYEKIARFSALSITILKSVLDEAIESLEVYKKHVEFEENEDSD